MGHALHFAGWPTLEIVMGYTTEFRGQFKVSPVMKPEHAEYLRKFKETRRMKRHPKIAETLADPVRVAAGLPIGKEGGYFVGGSGYAGQDDDTSVLDHNIPPSDQPSLWCQWTPTDANDAIEWDGGEKFYDYVEWITYLINHFLKPWGYTVNGEVKWQGEDMDDRGVITVTNNEVSSKQLA